MVILALREQPCIREADARARFGTDGEFDPASPHAPPDSPSYRIYRRPFGQLRLAIRDSTGCLVSVVLDPTARP
jgi:hypothetical protein